MSMTRTVPVGATYLYHMKFNSRTPSLTTPHTNTNTQHPSHTTRQTPPLSTDTQLQPYQTPPTRMKNLYRPTSQGICWGSVRTCTSNATASLSWKTSVIDRSTSDSGEPAPPPPFLRATKATSKYRRASLLGVRSWIFCGGEVGGHQVWGGGHQVLRAELNAWGIGCVYIA